MCSACIFSPWCIGNNWMDSLDNKCIGNWENCRKSQSVTLKRNGWKNKTSCARDVRMCTEWCSYGDVLAGRYRKRKIRSIKNQAANDHQSVVLMEKMKKETSFFSSTRGGLLLIPAPFWHPVLLNFRLYRLCAYISCGATRFPSSK